MVHRLRWGHGCAPPPRPAARAGAGSAAEAPIFLWTRKAGRCEAVLTPTAASPPKGRECPLVWNASRPSQRRVSPAALLLEGVRPPRHTAQSVQENPGEPVPSDPEEVIPWKVSVRRTVRRSASLRLAPLQPC
ncbi:hypothetical protein GCM10023168_32140 [Fodinibacter luteus]|uniref:Uncharacterized protein n=1 Tax=Fodinibacter luteus TaxID=552064 RepID=A0ABP8KP04_9MICO